MVYVTDYSGILHVLDANTGKALWEYDTFGHMWGSTLVADGKVFLGDEDGDFVILKAAKEMEVLSEANLGSPIYSTPIVANGVLYVGSQTHLYAVHDEARTRTSDELPKVELER